MYATAVIVQSLGSYNKRSINSERSPKAILVQQAQYIAIAILADGSRNCSDKGDIGGNSCMEEEGVVEAAHLPHSTTWVPILHLWLVDALPEQKLGFERLCPFVLLTSVITVLKLMQASPQVFPVRMNCSLLKVLKYRNSGNFCC